MLLSFLGFSLWFSGYCNPGFNREASAAKKATVGIQQFNSSCVCWFKVASVVVKRKSKLSRLMVQVNCCSCYFICWFATTDPFLLLSLVIDLPWTSCSKWQEPNVPYNAWLWAPVHGHRDGAAAQLLVVHRYYTGAEIGSKLFISLACFVFPSWLIFFNGHQFTCPFDTREI